MTDVKISELPAASTLDGAELVPLVQSGVTVQSTTAALAASSGFAGYGPIYAQSYGNSSVGLLAAHTANGYAQVSGEFIIDDDVTLSGGSLCLDHGAYFTIASGKVLTLTDVALDIPQQYVFRGSGTVSVASRLADVHVDWWGARGDNSTQSAPGMAACALSLAGSTESVAHLSIGVYLINANIEWPRATWVCGDGGPRRTNIITSVTTGNTFSTLDVGCRFTGLQFEPSTSKTAGACIYSAFENTVIDGVYGRDAPILVQLDGLYSNASNIRRFTSTSAGATADFCAVKITKAGCWAENIEGPTVWDPSGAEAAVTGNIVIVEASSATVSDIYINNVNQTFTSGSGGNGVSVRSTGASGTMNGIQVSGIRAASVGLDRCFQIINSSSATISNIVVQGVYGGNSATQVLAELENTSSGQINNVALSGLAGLNGAAALNLIETSGTIDDISLSNSSVDLLTAVVTTSGTPTGIRISNMVREVNSAVVLSQTIADDAAYTYDFGAVVFTLSFIVSSNTSGLGRGIFSARAASTPFCQVIASTGGTITPTTGVLTGTTGVDGVVTVSVSSSGVLYLENRSGASAFFNIAIFQGGVPWS